MDEARLSPQLGRLIDRAKAAVSQVNASDIRAEVVALLTDDGSIHSGYAGVDPAMSDTSAAAEALACAQRCGCATVTAAAVTVARDPADTVLPSRGSREVLADINPDLPVVFKHHGRWVVRPLSKVPDRQRSPR